MEITLNNTWVKSNTATKFLMCKSHKQLLLEAQGCVFKSQERLDRHELDITKKCYCGRPKKKPE